MGSNDLQQQMNERQPQDDMDIGQQDQPMLPVQQQLENHRQPQHQANQQNAPSFRDAVKKIRFLTLLPKQFAETVARSNILTKDEAFAILMNISSPSHDIYPMPPGFSTSTKSRAYLDTPCVPVAPTERNSGTMQRIQPFFGFREEDCRGDNNSNLVVAAAQSAAVALASMPAREPTPRNMIIK